VSLSFEFSEPDLFTTGAVGPPGERIFFLQAREGTQVASLKLEKQQVAALADYLAEQLADTPETAARTVGDLTLLEPAVPEWIVGPLGIAYDDDVDRFVLVAEELVEAPDAERGIEPATARFRLRRDQIAAFVDHARQVVEAGRPPCILCGQPVDPAGHACPRNN
jgi:uncharacterized repeat protein (TIGR03847 family)